MSMLFFKISSVQCGLHVKRQYRASALEIKAVRFAWLQQFDLPGKTVVMLNRNADSIEQKSTEYSTTSPDSKVFGKYVRSKQIPHSPVGSLHDSHLCKIPYDSHGMCWADFWMLRWHFYFWKSQSTSFTNSDIKFHNICETRNRNVATSPQE